MVRESWPSASEPIARYRESFPTGRPDPQLSRGSPGAELLATRDARAYAEWLCREPLLRLTPDGDEPDREELDGDGGELRGLVLRGGHGGTGLPEDNPWNLPAIIDVERAI